MIITITANVSPSQELFDKRPTRFGMKIGTVENICKQYGIKYQWANDKWNFFSSKKQMQFFAERLHFAGIKFTEL